MRNNVTVIVSDEDHLGYGGFTTAGDARIMLKGEATNITFCGSLLQLQFFFTAALSRLNYLSTHKCPRCDGRMELPSSEDPEDYFTVVCDVCDGDGYIDPDMFMRKLETF